jgi:hypothetical protein
MHGAAYNSRISLATATPGMLTLLSSRFVSSVVFVLVWLFAVPASPQNWSGAEEQLAGKIVSAIGPTKPGPTTTGPTTMAVVVLNRSPLSTAMTDDIRRNLLTQLASLGIRFVPVEQAAVTVQVSLSEDLRSYVWVAEIHQGANASSVVMVSVPRPAAVSVEPEAAAMVLRKIPLWSQPERILDVAVSDGNPARMLVLDANGVAFYRFQEGRWQPEQSLAIVHSRPWPRDLRGRLVLGKDNNNKDHPFDAYLPGVYCRGSAGAPPAMTCSYSDDSWPVGTDPFSLNASFTSSRNFFSGVLSPAVGQLTKAPAFYSAAAVPGEKATRWLLATVDGQIHLLDGITDQVVGKLGWGSDIATVHSGCGSGWQVLASGSREGRGDSDVVQAFEVASREPIAASPPLEVNGAITALWTESGGTGAVAVLHNSETGRYEAFRLTLACDH